MKIGELPHREFSYCFLSASPKCEASDTPTGGSISFLGNISGSKGLKGLTGPKGSQPNQQTVKQSSHSGVAVTRFGVVCRSGHLSTGGTRLSPRLPAVIEVQPLRGSSDALSRSHLGQHRPNRANRPKRIC